MNQNPNKPFVVFGREERKKRHHDENEREDHVRSGIFSDIRDHKRNDRKDEEKQGTNNAKNTKWGLILLRYFVFGFFPSRFIDDETF